MTASYRPDSAAYLATSGNSNAPGTSNRSTSVIPPSSRACRAPRSSRSASSSSNRATHSATRRSDAIVATARPRVLLLVVEHLLVERKPLMVERVAELVALGAQVCLVVRVWRVLDRKLIAD